MSNLEERAYDRIDRYYKLKAKPIKLGLFFIYLDYAFYHMRITAKETKISEVMKYVQKTYRSNMLYILEALGSYIMDIPPITDLHEPFINTLVEWNDKIPNISGYIPKYNLSRWKIRRLKEDGYYQKIMSKEEFSKSIEGLTKADMIHLISMMGGDTNTDYVQKNPERKLYVISQTNRRS